MTSQNTAIVENLEYIILAKKKSIQSLGLNLFIDPACRLPCILLREEIFTLVELH